MHARAADETSRAPQHRSIAGWPQSTPQRQRRRGGQPARATARCAHMRRMSVGSLRRGSVAVGRNSVDHGSSWPCPPAASYSYLERERERERMACTCTCTGAYGAAPTRPGAAVAPLARLSRAPSTSSNSFSWRLAVAMGMQRSAGGQTARARDIDCVISATCD